MMSLAHVEQHVHVGSRCYNTPGHAGVAILRWLDLHPLRDTGLSCMCRLSGWRIRGNDIPILTVVMLTPILSVIAS